MTAGYSAGPVGASRSGPWWVRPGRQAWSLPARAGLALLALGLSLWDLSHNGTANAFYAAAVKSGTQSWKAFFFGSFDPASFTTVDKPPASLWLMGLSARLFGFSPASLLVPQALCGVASVLALYHVVRRWAGELAALLAGLALALTPIALAVFRYDNPDALLTLLLVLAAWALWAALESGRTWPLVVCGALLGLAFNTKELEAYVLVPVLALTYLWAGPPALGRRVVQLLWGALALALSSAWWIVAVELTPASSRPFVGGSGDNSELNVVFGYNGFGRLLGAGAGSSPSSVFGPGFGGSPGIGRMFGIENGPQVAWLLPLALAGLVAGLWLTRSAVRTDRLRAGFVLFGGWTVLASVVFSGSKGIFHPYYTVSMAPGIAALAGAGSVALWKLGRWSRPLAWALPLAVACSALWAAQLLAAVPGYAPGLGRVVLLAGLASAGGLLVALRTTGAARWLAPGAGALATVALLAGPAAYCITTITTPATGAIIVAGPTTPAVASVAPTADPGLAAYLVAHRDSATWLMAVRGAQAAAPYILATGRPVMALGGYSGTDPHPTLAGFRTLVARGRVRYVLVPPATDGAAALDDARSIEAWARNHGAVVPPTDYGGGRATGTLYRLGPAT